MNQLFEISRIHWRVSAKLLCTNAVRAPTAVSIDNAVQFWLAWSPHSTIALIFKTCCLKHCCNDGVQGPLRVHLVLMVCCWSCLEWRTYSISRRGQKPERRKWCFTPHCWQSGENFEHKTLVVVWPLMWILAFSNIRASMDRYVNGLLRLYICRQNMKPQSKR